MNMMQIKAFAEQHNPWKCRVVGGGAAQNLGNSTFSFPQMQIIIFDPSNMIVTGVGGAVYIPVDGIYHVVVSGGLSAAVEGTRLAVSIYKNNAEVKRGIDSWAGGSNPTGGMCSAIMYLKAGDKLQMAQYSVGAMTSDVTYVSISVAYLSAA